MLKGFVKPVGIVLGGILCIHVSVFAAESDTKKAPEPVKKAVEAPTKNAAPASAPAPKPTEAAKETATAKPKEVTPAPKQEEDPNKVLATVNGENIIQKDVNQIIGRFGSQIPKEQIAVVKKQVLEGVITQKLLTQFVKESKLEPTQADIDTELNKIREEVKANPSLEGKTLEQVLESHGGSIDDLKRDIIIDVALDKYLGKDVDDQKIREQFEKTKAQYNEEAEVRARHVLVDTRKLKTDAELAQALEKIKKAKAEVDAGKDFGEVAKQYSDCPSKERGGDLGFNTREQWVKPFADAAFALKVGQVSEPVKTEFGYHIIKVVDKKDAKEGSFDEVKDYVKQDLMKQKAQALIKQLREKAKIDIKAGA
ncbi:MAG TPA: peptidylprolyl isomerase [Candidatus Brocadiaceae bacterium]